MSNKLTHDSEEIQDVKQFLTKLHEYEKEKGVTPQLRAWYHSEDGARENENFVTRMKSLLVSTILAEDVEINPSIQGLIGVDYFTFHIGDVSYEYKTDWTKEQNYIFFHGAKAAAEHYTALIRNEVVSAAKNS